MLPLDLQGIISVCAGKSVSALYDLHVHITSYDVTQDNAVQKIPAAALARGLYGIAQTEHNELPALANRLGILPGMEVSCREGHVLVIGAQGDTLSSLTDYVHGPHDRVKLPTLAEVVENLHDAYAQPSRRPFLVLPHPVSGKGVLRNIDTVPRILYQPGITYFLEWANAERTVTGGHVRKTVESLGHLKPCKGLVAGSDAHGSRHVGLAGIATFDGAYSWDDAIQALNDGAHLCYQFKYRGEPESGKGTLYLTENRGNKREEYGITLNDETLDITSQNSDALTPFFS